MRFFFFFSQLCLFIFFLSFVSFFLMSAPISSFFCLRIQLFLLPIPANPAHISPFFFSLVAAPQSSSEIPNVQQLPLFRNIDKKKKNEEGRQGRSAVLIMAQGLNVSTVVYVVLFIEAASRLYKYDDLYIYIYIAVMLL